MSNIARKNRSSVLLGIVGIAAVIGLAAIVAFAPAPQWVRMLGGAGVGILAATMAMRFAGALKSAS